MSGQAKFEVFPDSEGKHRWRLRATNGEIVAQSEAYTRQEDAERGVRAAAEAVSQVLTAAIYPVKVQSEK